MEHFYVTLPSNSSETFYGKQPMSSYKTRLAKPLNLDVSEWEVGLAEIIYPRTWPNILDGKFFVRLLENDAWTWVETSIPSVMYESPTQLVDTLNDEVKRVLGKSQHDKIYFTFHPLLGKFTAFVEQGYYVRFPKALTAALGLGDDDSILKQSIHEEAFGVTETPTRLVYNSDKIIAPYCMDLNRGLHTFFIYCDVVEYQLVGDASVPLIRTIPANGKNGEVVVNSFNNIHYVGLGRSTFQEIHIHITDETGKKVPFERGRVVVKLHFRKT